MKQGLSLEVKNAAAVAAGIAAANSSSAVTCVRVIKPSWAARTINPRGSEVNAARLPVY
jgi:hypothetical protein